MLQWLSANLGTILICAVLIVIVGLIAGNLLRRKKQGKSSCGCGCESCAMHASCHTQK
ncbi:MAG: FeoB-associated Cys-rich membrane protein [Oscillospiraceae bacterium]